jgi:hypothetical protein
MLETWKSWRDGTYEVSDLGNVRRAKPGISTFVGRPVKPIMSAGGYAQVALKSENKTFRVYIHQAVIESFVGIRPPGTVVNHKDSDKSNNALVNLEYITHRENCEHSLREGTRKRGPSMPPRPKKGKQTGEAHWTHRTPERIARGERMPHTKLSVELVAMIRKLVNAGTKQCELAEELGISNATMSRVIRGKRWVL